MQLDEKARENLEAAERLLSIGDGAELPLHNAAASRAYYAAYQAVADRAQRERVEFDAKRGDYYRHDTLPLRARDWQILDDDQSEDLVVLHGLRVKADYMEDQVDYDEATSAADTARGIVESLLGTSP